jgi:hypothetical protein
MPTLTRIETSDYTGKDIAGLVNAPSEAGMSATTLKARFDSLVKDLVVARLNDVIDALNSTTVGDSGAFHVAFSATVKAAFNNLQAAVAGAYDYADQQIANAVFGEVSPSADNITVTDVAGYFTGTNVEAVLAELHDIVGVGVGAYDATLQAGALSPYLTSLATASKVLVTNSSGKLAVSALDASILSYLSGLTSSAQTQINGKMSGTKTVSTGYPTGGSDGDLWFRV